MKDDRVLLLLARDVHLALIVPLLPSVLSEAHGILGRRVGVLLLGLARPLQRAQLLVEDGTEIQRLRNLVQRSRGSHGGRLSQVVHGLLLGCKLVLDGVVRFEFRSLGGGALQRLDLLLLLATLARMLALGAFGFVVGAGLVAG